MNLLMFRTKRSPRLYSSLSSSSHLFHPILLRILIFGIAFWFGISGIYAQENPSENNHTKSNFGEVNGSFQIDAQYYTYDSLIRTPKVDEKARMNAYGNIVYRLGSFSAGLRYEAYLPGPLLGIDPQYQGNGIANRFVSFTKEKYSITVGNFYEQFGNGMTLRAWWEPLLGYDNSIDGARITANPLKGVQIKGVWGKQRIFWGESAGTVRGGDIEWNLGESLDSLWKNKWNITMGGSFVSRFQPLKTLTEGQFIYNIPQNVACYSGRLVVQNKGFRIYGEYARKINDPSTVNNKIYRHGDALIVNVGYTKKGFGFTLEGKRLDNMDYRSDITQTGQNLQVNFLPPIAKQHAYRLPTLYIYATQPMGEMGIQGDLYYKFKKNTFLGGKYGTNLIINFAKVHGLDTVHTNDDLGYTSSFLKFGKREYYTDVNVEIQKKLSPKLKAGLMYINLLYNKDQILGLKGYGDIRVNAAILDVLYEFDDKHSLRTEFQVMTAKQISPHIVNDFGDWVMLMLEYNISPHWSFVLSDEYNYGNVNANLRLHYYSAMVAFVLDNTRFSLSYGRVREGLNCSGGICRPIPSMNGLFLSVTSTF